ncbi:IS5 family transposase [Streptomyces sp. NPDC058301]|uniref:IS5 family transposase n=1 Tax=Streptomyces sp. NPDC058301 TaxID=3346436 RepID=UPI0036E64C33
MARPLLPPARVRPQGGGVANIDDEAVFAAIVYVLVSGCAWRALPPCFGASKSTVHRRFLLWSRAGVWGRLHQRVLQLLDEQGLVELVPCGPRLGSRPREKGGELAGPSPVDRGKPGSRMHILSDADGLPLRGGLSAANTHDSLALKPMLSHFHMGHETHAGDSKPTRLHADKAYDIPHLRRWL